MMQWKPMLAVLAKGMLFCGLGSILHGTPLPEAMEAGTGYAHFRLRPAAAPAQDLNGAYLSGRMVWNPGWSLEGMVVHQKGSDREAVFLRQWGLQAGPGFTWNLQPRLRAWTHVLLGAYRLDAEQGQARDWRASASATPGLGLDVDLRRRLALRMEVDEVLTRYAGQTQHNLSFSMGLACRWR